MCRRGLQACAWLVLIVLPSQHATAHADAPAQTDSAEAMSEPPGYGETVDEAVREFQGRNYEESSALFARAHALFPNARTYRGLALAEFELRKYPECISHLEAALRSTVKPLNDELKLDTERMLARANRFVARIVVETKPRVSRIMLDELPVDISPGQELMLKVGDHTLEIKAPGFAAEKQLLNIQGGENKTLVIILARSEQATSTQEQKRAWYKSPWLWTAVGVVAAGAAAGAAVAVTRDSSKTADFYKGSTGALATAP